MPFNFANGLGLNSLNPFNPSGAYYNSFYSQYNQNPNSISNNSNVNNNITDNGNYPPAPQILYNYEGTPYKTQMTEQILKSPLIGDANGILPGANNTANLAIQQSKDFGKSSFWNQAIHNPDNSYNFDNIFKFGNLAGGIGQLGLGFAQYSQMKKAADRAYQMQKRQEARNVSLTNTQIRDRADSRAQADPSNAAKYQQWGRDNQIK